MLLIAPVMVSGLVSVADLLGILDSVPWLAQRVSTITLLLVGFVAGYLVIERRSVLDSSHLDLKSQMEEIAERMDTNLRITIDSLKGVETRHFTNATDLLSYVGKRLSQARISIDDLSWSPAVGLAQGLKGTRQANQIYQDRLRRAARRLPYREVFIFNKPGRLAKLQERLTENLEGYSCAYYEESSVPLLQFMIIDREEVIFLSDQYPVYVAVKQADIVRLFAMYYEVIWQHALPLKIGLQLNTHNTEKVLQQQ